MIQNSFKEPLNLNWINFVRYPYTGESIYYCITVWLTLLAINNSMMIMFCFKCPSLSRRIWIEIHWFFLRLAEDLSNHPLTKTVAWVTFYLNTKSETWGHITHAIGHIHWEGNTCFWVGNLLLYYKQQRKLWSARLGVVCFMAMAFPLIQVFTTELL